MCPAFPRTSCLRERRAAQHYLSTITGDDWRLSFGRKQGVLPGGYWADIAAVSDVTIPHKRLSVYADRSSPVGSSPTGSYSRPRSLSEFNTAEVMREFAAFLKCTVLAQTLAHPEVTERADPWPEPPAVPWPPNIGPMFCFADDRDVARIRQGQSDKTELPAHERWAMHGAGWRLASLDIPNDGTVPEIAYSGFTWCGLGEIVDPSKPRIPGAYRHSDRHTLRVKPKLANGIYIADHGAMEARRAELAAAINAAAVLRGVPARNRFTDEEMFDFMRARARTIIPITAYRGGFAEPVILVNRELGFDEVEIIKA